jgi:hypothetical protein
MIRAGWRSVAPVAGLAALLWTQAGHAQLLPRLATCLATTTADSAFAICAPASQAYGISVEDWERTTAHYVELLIAEDRAEEALVRLGNIRDRKSPHWVMFLQGLAMAPINAGGALYDFQESIDAGVSLDEARRAQVLAIVRPTGREALARLAANAYPAGVPKWEMQHRPDFDRDVAKRAFTLVLTLEPGDGEAQAALEWLAGTQEAAAQ